MAAKPPANPNRANPTATAATVAASGCSATPAEPSPEPTTELPPETTTETTPETIPETTKDRYQDLRRLGSGGFGEVRRVRDHKLGRDVAMKILHPDVDAAPRLRARFLAEIRLTAGLQHPGIVAVYDFGELPDGRMWFTMPEVRGRTLRAVIDEVHAAAAGTAAGEDSASRFTPRRLIDVFARVCETMAYAHGRGVIHRDLKPDNIMVGELGQVLVMDWGLARRADADLTRHGDVLGTPAYMPPEQARGEVHRHGPAADVYALGAILYHALAGRPPYDGPGGWRQVLAAPPPPVAEAARPSPAAPAVPAALAAICARAMAREPDERYPHAGALAAAIVAWLDGAQRRERALAALAETRALGPAITDLRARADRLHTEAKQRLSDVRPFDPEDAKLPGWTLEDRAEDLERAAALQETRWIQGVHGALAIDPDLAEAHAALAGHYRDKLLEAERERRRADAVRFEELLRAHDRGQHAATLSGRGALTLHTEPAGARVTLYRYTPHGRRLVPERIGALGRTPLIEVALDRGSYLLRITAPGHTEVRYPVLIERGDHWHGCPPGSTTPLPVPLPRAGDLAEGEIYVPPGWTWTGGDPDAPDGLPRCRVWIDGFVIGRFPVTNAEYIAFLDDLVAAGCTDEALAACPRANRGTVAGADAQLAYDRDAAGRFRLRAQDAGEVWRPRSPAVLMSWHGAMAYARWLAARTGRPARLPGELEREKAVRGADGRLFPWGHHLDPTWACMLSSHAGEPARVDVDAYPVDESPYGMRGGAGNTRDWCIDTWTHAGPAIRDGRLCIEAAPAGSDDYRAVRGGAWSSVANLCRAAARFANRPWQRRSTIGLRVARAYP